MILPFRRFILSVLGFLLLAFFGQPLWTVVHGALVKLPSPTESLTTASAPVGDVASKRSLASGQSYGKSPIYFEPNVGQTDSQVKFIARGNGATTFLTATEAVFALPIADFGSPSGKQSIKVVGDRDSVVWDQRTLNLNPWNVAVGLSDSQLRPTSHPLHRPRSAIANRQSAISMKLVGANPKAQMEGLDRLPGISNYFIGNDPAKWRSNVPHYGKVRYRGVYPGIDLVYYGNPLRMEFDFVVHPGAEPGAIQLSFEGSDAIRGETDGSLSVQRWGAEMSLRKPVIYQSDGESKSEIEGHYATLGNGRVSFEVQDRDMSKLLVIDPEVQYFRILGGRATDLASSIAIDPTGSIYVTGITNSADFPSTAGAFQAELKPGQCGGADAYQCFDQFVTKLSPDGKTLLYSTFIGGTGSDTSSIASSSIAVNGAGEVFLAGSTESTDFPVTPGALKTSFAGGICGRLGSGQRPIPCTDAFVLKLNSAGNSLLYSTYLGGTGFEHTTSLAVDAAGHGFVSGVTTSLDFPLANAIQPAPGGMADGFVAKLNPSGTALIYSTYLGGTGSENDLKIAVDSAGSAFVTGTTDSTNFPTKNPLQSQNRGQTDVFLTKINSAGNVITYSSYIGGSQSEHQPSIALDATGNAYVAGITYSQDFPTSQAFQPTLAGRYDLFVSKWNSAGSALLYSTYLGGSGDEYGATAIAVDSAGNAHVAGNTYSTDFPLVNPAVVRQGRNNNGFLAKLNPSGTELLYASFLSHGPAETAGLAMDNSGNAYLAGVVDTYSYGSPNLSDVFVTKVSPNQTSVPPTFFVPIVLSASGLIDSRYTTELVLVNRSNKDATVELIYTAAFGGGSGSASATLPAGQQRIVPNGIEYLRSRGLAIPVSPNQGGTLFVRFLGLPRYFDAAVIARTTTPTPAGSVGVAYSAVPTLAAFSEPVYLCALRQNAMDRSNVAIQNAGLPGSSDITLRLTAYSGDPTNPQQAVLPDEILRPGEFKQITEVLKSNGLSLTNGYIRVERTSGTAPYYAYGVINDQLSSDGSFVPPVAAAVALSSSGAELPAVLETGSFATEVVLTNFSNTRRTYFLRYFADNIQTTDKVIDSTVVLEPGEQRIIPNYLEFLRSIDAPGVQDKSLGYVGKLMVSVAGSTDGMFVGARTLTAESAGRYGVFYPARPFGNNQSASTGWVYGLQQDSNTRTNLAIASSGVFTSGVFNVDLFNGDTGQRVSTIENISVGRNGWKQIGSILANYAPGVRQGYARVRAAPGTFTFGFITYAVINDGGAPGERTGDGAFIASAP